VRAAPATSRDLVLVGGGHTHALALRMLAMAPIAGLRTTLVSPASHTPYSGMLPGLVAGHYRFEETHIDLARLCQWAGVRFIAAEVTALDPAARRLALAGRPALEYDVVSLDIGSQPELDSVPGARQHAVPVKPVAGLWQRWEALLQRLDGRPGGSPLRIAVVGGGAGGVELALAMAHRLAGRPVSFELACAGAQILEGYNRGARRAVAAALVRHGITLRCGARVTAVEAGELVLAGGGRLPFDELFWCTGAAAAPWIAASGMAVDARGFLAVTDTLQSPDDPRVFGAGDIAAQVAHPRPKAGVYAVRQGPVLAHNLRALLLGRPLREHRPQRRFLSLVSLGDRSAAADKWLFSASGAWVWRWKDRIDRAFMARFTDLPTNMAREPRDALAPPDGASAKPHCGGCGAKVGANQLKAVLAELAAEHPGNCPLAGTAEDAVPVPTASGATVVQSLDILRELVSDPWLMGRLAAGHALSDLYATGARPVSALAAVTLPFAAAEILRRDLKQYLAGALHEFAAAGCPLQGGHSLQGAELQLGFVVNGVPMDPGRGLLGKRGLAPGDRLILTKPLGTGVLFAAHMQLAADGRDITAAIGSMLQGNRAAAELALAHGATAATDVTGFGLLGHLLEMLGPGQGARLSLQALPLLPGVEQLIAAGERSTMHESNAAARAELAAEGEIDPVRAELLFDPQTCGGLLLGIGAGRADALVEALRAAGFDEARTIGEITAHPAGAPRVVCRT